MPRIPTLSLLSGTFFTSQSMVSHVSVAWSTGVALLCHCVCFFSVAYFDQMIFNFFWLVSAIAAGTQEKGWLVGDRIAQPARQPAMRADLMRSPS